MFFYKGCILSVEILRHKHSTADYENKLWNVCDVRFQQMECIPYRRTLYNKLFRYGGWPCVASASTIYYRRDLLLGYHPNKLI